MRHSFIIIFLCLSCQNGTAPVNKSLLSKDSSVAAGSAIDTIHPLTSDSGKIIEVGYLDNFEKTPQITIESASEKEFLILKPNVYLKQTKIEKNSKEFYLQTIKKKHSFRIYKDYGGEKSWSGYNYNGYYPELQLYAITEITTSENLGFAQLSLLDSLTDNYYNLISFGDGSVELPIPSLDKQYMVYYYNAAYENKNCDIGILKISDRKQANNYLREHAFYHSDEFAIEQIKWKTNHCFYIKGYEEVYINDQWEKKFSYYKATFK